MKAVGFLLVAVMAMVGVVALITPVAGRADNAPVFVNQIPRGYRDWKVISVAHEEGNLNSLGAILGNDAAIQAYRERKFPFPDGTIIAALHFRHTPSEENNKVFGRDQSFVPGVPTNVQFNGQGLNQICRYWRLGIRSFQCSGWQARRRSVYEDLLALS